MIACLPRGVLHGRLFVILIALRVLRGWRAGRNGVAFNAPKGGNGLVTDVGRLFKPIILSARVPLNLCHGARVTASYYAKAFTLTLLSLQFLD